MKTSPACKLTDYDHWRFNFLRKQGYTVAVVAPTGEPVCGDPADLPIMNQALQGEESKQ